MFEIAESFRASLNAPWHIILACPLGLVFALHFASQKRNIVYAPDSSASLSSSRSIERPKMEGLRQLCFYLSLLMATMSFLFMLDPIRATGFVEFTYSKLFFLVR